MSEQNQEKKPPPPYDPNAQNGQQQHQGDGQPPQGYSQQAGYQPVPQDYGQQGYQPQGYQQPHQYAQPQDYEHQYGIQPVYGGQPQQHVVIAQPVRTMIAAFQPSPTNYLIPAIFACICCFWPTGICAIIAASNANSAAGSGDMENAKEKTRTARNLIIVTVVLGVIVLVLTIVLRVAASSKSSANNYYYQ